MDVSYLVRGYITKSDIENKTKQIMYVGTSPKQAFSFKGRYSDFAEIEVEIWENGQMVFRHK
jgi:hypothetical protein